MFYGKSKRIIVIKDIHSNLFEEAILVLKDDRDQEQEKQKNQNSSQVPNYKNDFILKEAEAIINNYIKDNKATLTSVNKKPVAKNNLVNSKINNSKFMKNLIINSALLGSIAAVVFLLLKLF